MPYSFLSLEHDRPQNTSINRVTRFASCLALTRFEDLLIASLARRGSLVIQVKPRNLICHDFAHWKWIVRNATKRTFLAEATRSEKTIDAEHHPIVRRLLLPVRQLKDAISRHSCSVRADEILWSGTA